MSNAPISNEVALRIGLAARCLPESDPKTLLRILDAVVGLPPTLDTLAGLTVRQFKAAAAREIDAQPDAIRDAVAVLKGERGVPGLDPAPQPVAYRRGDMPGSLRVACASNGGDRVDGHFGACPRFLIYQVSAGEIRLVDVREPVGGGGDRSAARAALIGDCQILVTASIGGPAAAKVVRHGVHPIKHSDGGPAPVYLAALKRVIGRGAPPWLGKAAAAGA